MATMRSKFYSVFDVESTGVDVESDRIVQAFVGLMDDQGTMVERETWLIDPGIEIPTGASDVHGYTTERIQAEGRKDIGKALMEIATRLDVYDRKGYPVIIMNAPYDLTILDRELRRHVGLKTFRPASVVLDPFVLDKGIDKFRKGKRKLVNLAEHYGVEVLQNAHDAEADCWMTGNVMLKLLQHPRLMGMSLEQIHAKTIPTKREQAQGLEIYFNNKRKSDPATVNDPPIKINPEWPMHAWVEPETEG